MTPTNNARIYIAGGYGLVGSTIARHIRKINKDIEIILAGRNPDKGIPLANELGKASTVYLDLENNPDLRDITNIDLIIAALHDPADFLTHTAFTQGIAYIGISKMADEVVPVTFAALRTPPKRPIVHLSHWQAGVLTIIAQKIAEQFSQIHTIATAGLYDSHPAADGGLHLPETLLQPDRAITRFKQFGVQIRQIEEL